jgi:hypothetical protein
MVEELIRGFLHEDWVERLDFSTLEKVGNSFVSDDLRERHSDLIWRVRLKGEGAGWVYLYLLLELQSTPDPFMAVRLLTYVGLLFEEIIRKERLKPGDRLPAVLPVVLYNGDRSWRAPLRLESHFVSVPGPLKRHLPRLSYVLLDERRLELSRPELRQNRPAALFRIETNENPEALPGLSQEIDRLVPPEDADLRRGVYTWLDSVVRRTFPDAIIPEGMDLKEAPMLEQTLIKWRKQIEKQARKEARLEGRVEGRLEGRRDMLLKQMTFRFGRLPEEVRSRVQQVTSTKELDRLTRKVLSASSLQDMGLS